MAFTASKAAGKLSIVAARLAWGAPWLGLGRPQGVPLHPSDTESLTSPARTGLAKMEICAILLAIAGSNPAVARLATRREPTSPKLTSDRRAQPEMAEGFFLFESAVTH